MKDDLIVTQVTWEPIRCAPATVAHINAVRNTPLPPALLNIPDFSAPVLLMDSLHVPSETCHTFAEGC